MNTAQRAVRTALAVDVGPAIVWAGRWPERDAVWVQSDTHPTVHAVIEVDGGVSTPLDAVAFGELPAAPDDLARWERIVRAMLAAAARQRAG